MRVSELYAPNGPFVGQDIYIVGHGSSMAVFHTKALEGRTCILLNDVQQYFPSLGPIAIANTKKFLQPLSPTIRYPIVKGRKRHDPDYFVRDDNHVAWDHPSYYVFSYRIVPGDIDDVGDWTKLWAELDYYWTGGTVACFAIQFAAQAGARSIILVGCDCGMLHGHRYHIDMIKARRSHGPKANLSPDDRKRIGWRKTIVPKKGESFSLFPLYLESILKLKREVRDRFGIPTLTLTPFFGTVGFDQQFDKMLS